VVVIDATKRSSGNRSKGQLGSTRRPDQYGFRFALNRLPPGPQALVAGNQSAVRNHVHQHGVSQERRAVRRCERPPAMRTHSRLAVIALSSFLRNSAREIGQMTNCC